MPTSNLTRTPLSRRGPELGVTAHLAELSVERGEIGLVRAVLPGREAGAVVANRDQDGVGRVRGADDGTRRPAELAGP